MKEEKEPEFDNWRDAWNYHAVKQSEDYKSFSEKKLLEFIENKEWDTFYTIWDAIKKKGTIKNSSWILFNVLVEETEEWADLVRHHCAEALFTILGIEEMEDFRAHCHIDLGDRPESLEKLKQIIEKKLKELNK